MKKTIITFLTIFAATGAFAQGDSFTLDGTIAGKDNGYVYLNYNDKANKPVQDSAAIKDHKFSFKGVIDGPTSAYIRISKSAMSMSDPNLVSFFMEPATMTLRLTYGSFKDFELTGSKMQADMARLTKLKAGVNAELKPYIDAYTAINDEYIAARRANKPEAEQEALHKKANDARNAFDPFNARLDKIDYAFFKDNPDSYVTAYLLLFKTSSLPLDSMLLFYNGMTERVKKSNFGKLIDEEIAKLKKGAPGAVATNFNVPDINGKHFNLADQKGKFVIIDFWASWCVPCREGNPHLKQLYAKYKDKGLEIVGVSDDDSAIDAWKKAVAQDGIGIWRHVLRGLKRTPTGYDRTNDISENYGIHSLPTKILVDRNGIIIGRYGGGGESDEAMDRKLAEVMK